MKKLLIFLFAVACVLPLGAENRAFRTLEEAQLYVENEKGTAVEKIPVKVAKGDTVYANQQTYEYLAENKNKSKTRIPIEYKGTDALIYVKNIHPIKLEDTDVLEYLNDHSVEPGSFQEQTVIPMMEWAMNAYPNPMIWIYIALIALGCGVGFRFLSGVKGFGFIGLTLVGCSLAVLSGAEIMYFLCYEPHALWFLKSGIVGGWGRVILNFIILAIVCGAQAYLFYDLWKSSFTVGDKLTISFRKKDYDDDDDDDEEEKTPKWIVNAAYLPLIFGVAIIVLVIFNASATVYYIMGALLVGAALAGTFYQCAKGRLIQGIVFPVCFVAAAIGLTVMVMTLGTILLLVAIVGVVAVLAVMFVGSLLVGLIKGPDRVDFVDQYGRKHSGTRQFNGTVKGDDGKYYKLDD